MIVKEITLKEFPTHVPLTKTKMFKISTQGVYNSKLHYHSRSKVIDTLKNYIRHNITDVAPVKTELFPVKIQLLFFAPSNWGNVRMSKGFLKWSPAKDGYHPVHDLDNLAWIWGKTIQDCLVDKKILPDDTIEYINHIEYVYILTEELNERKIVIKLIK
jgi:hypothetical protein